MLTRSSLAGLCRARDLLRATCHRPLPVSEAAAAAAMSRFHFIRRFRAVFGETPHQFRIRARLDQARRLLAHGNASVTDVCMEVGFSSLGSFSSLFTRRVGRPPSAYRRHLRAQALDGSASATGLTVAGAHAHGPVTIAVCADTCGNLIQLYQPARP